MIQRKILESMSFFIGQNVILIKKGYNFMGQIQNWKISAALITEWLELGKSDFYIYKAQW